MLVLGLQIKHVVLLFLRFRLDPHLLVSPQMLFSSSGCAVVWQESEIQRRPRWATSLRSNLSAIICDDRGHALHFFAEHVRVMYVSCGVWVRSSISKILQIAGSSDRAFSMQSPFHGSTSQEPAFFKEIRGEVEGTGCGSIGLQ